MSFARARDTVLAGQGDNFASCTWDFALSRLVAPELRAEGSQAQAPSRLEPRGSTKGGEHAEMDFEEYVVLRGFVDATCLEEQFRFLWGLLDRDRDGFLSRGDLRNALQFPAVLLGWDERATDRWMQWTLQHVLGNTPGKQIGPMDLRSALARSPQLRSILMAREPAAR